MPKFPYAKNSGYTVWPRVRIQHWIVIPIPGHNLTLNHDSGSQFNVEFRPGIIIQHGIKTRGHNSMWDHDPGWTFNVESWSGSQFHVESWPGVTLQRGFMTRGHNSTLNYDPGQNSTLNYDPRSELNSILNFDPNPGSQLNIESWLRVKIQRRIKTWGHNSTGVQILYVVWVVIQWPLSRGEGRNSTWKISWILSTARWIKTRRVEIQWVQNSILYRKSNSGLLLRKPRL